MAMTTERIEINPAIMMGKPVIRGTRITVELILRKLAEGASEAPPAENLRLDRRLLLSRVSRFAPKTQTGRKLESAVDSRRRARKLVLHISMCLAYDLQDKL